MDAKNSLPGKLGQELRRGSAVLAVLLMADEQAYGYSLVQDLQEAGIEVEQNTLYPLLRRLDSQGLLESLWDTGESRPRKYYRITGEGRRVREVLTQNWQELSAAMEGLIASKENLS